MLGILDTDNYTSLHYNPRTGVNSREWIRYADNTFEPVRRNGNVNRKSRNRPGAPDWWVTERPLDWDPTEHGHEVTLNHDYGTEVSPAYDKDMENKPPEYSKLPYYETGRKSYAKMSADSGGGGGSEGSDGSEGGTKGGDEGPSGGGLDKEKGKSPKGGGTTLTQGSEGFWEMQAREKGAESGDDQAAGPSKSANDTAGVDLENLINSAPKNESQAKEWFEALGRADLGTLTPEQQQRLNEVLSGMEDGRGPVEGAVIGGLRELTGRINRKRAEWGIKDPEPPLVGVGVR